MSWDGVRIAALDAPMKFDEVFTDATVARMYRRRPPYPDAVFGLLARRIVLPRTVLDAGAGTGALARHMVAFAERIDAVEPSAAMIAEGRLLAGGTDRRIRWIRGSAERAPIEPTYGLITCGESLHWMDLGVVLPRFRGVLAPDARLAVVGNGNVHGAYREDVWAVTDRYAVAPKHPETADAVAAVRASGLFKVEEEERTEAMPFEQSVDDYIDFLHSTSVLTHAQLGERAQALDAELRKVFARRGIERLRYGVVATITWAVAV